MLNWKVTIPTFASFTAITFLACVAFGLVVPQRFHAAWLLEAMLPGFRWLTLPSVLLGLVETAVYGAAAGTLWTALYNYFTRLAARNTSATTRLHRAA